MKNQTVKSWFAGITLTWDLWDWNYTSSRSSQATEEVLQSREKREILKDQIELEVYNNYLSVISEKQKITLSKLTVESAKENYRLVEDKYNNQLATSTELINAETDLIDAEIRLTTSIADYSLAITKLKMTAGRKIY
jgi:outer membrane protein TolC